MKRNSRQNASIGEPKGSSYRLQSRADQFQPRAHDFSQFFAKQESQRMNSHTPEPRSQNPLAAPPGVVCSDLACIHIRNKLINFMCCLFVIMGITVGHCTDHALEFLPILSGKIFAYHFGGGTELRNNISMSSPISRPSTRLQMSAVNLVTGHLKTSQPGSNQNRPL